MDSENELFNIYACLYSRLPALRQGVIEFEGEIDACAMDEVKDVYGIPMMALLTWVSGVTLCISHRRPNGDGVRDASRSEPSSIRHNCEESLFRGERKWYFE